jgi:3-deoxy-manno-octulosonate cytidylyltransferase (CMP-KDO synthetase)
VNYDPHIGSTNLKIVGVIPVRMAASRFPGKPLHPICGRPMMEHVYLRAKMFKQWNQLVLATCDAEISQFANDRSIPVVMTGSHHTRALDRVAEAVECLGEAVCDNDIIVCVQGDEPMLRPDMIDAVVSPLVEQPKIHSTVLAIHITDKALWLNSDIVKVIHNDAGEVLYTSRVPIPYCKGEFSRELMARRIGGIFAFRRQSLREFTEHPETRLEKLEACDSNRILDMPFRQYIAPYRDVHAFSVDSPADIQLVERHMVSDEFWALYK